MRKLLKLVAIGVLLTVGPIQAFAANTFSDELQIFNSGVPIVDFQFYDTATSDNGQSEHLLDPPLIGTPPTVWNGGEQAFLVTLDHVTHDSTSSNFVLSLSESDGSISDTLWANFKENNLVDIYLFNGSPPANLNLFPPGTVTNGSLVSNPITEETFANAGGNATPFLGLTTPGLMVLFASDPGFLAPIPEPEIYAMMGIGLALMGFVARRRKGQASAA